MSTKSTLSVIVNTRSYFFSSLQQALFARRIETLPAVEIYLVDVLEKFLLTDKLYDESNSSGKKTRETLAEMMLRASAATPRQRADLLRKLGDSALYISGFFGQSLQRKIVDIDYYINMGTTAYSSLAKEIDEDTFSQAYTEISNRFTDFVDVFTLMSQGTRNPKNGPDLFRQMEVLSKTGSPLILEQLSEQGIFPDATQIKKCKNH
ncbi:MAG: hypothetical protein IT287_02595 [Bdellovibrionaceae bacterium]|nr:hypothetical protein [Pseudobdellovibrionaceae bacterium]